jgi:colicin import membrane protein
VETLNDKVRAWVLAALVHLTVVALLLAGLFWTATAAKPTLAGPVIEAELVGLTSAPKPRASRAPPPKPAPKPPEPKPEPTPPAPTRNDQIEREKIAEIAQQKATDAKRAQDEKQRQEQILLEQQEREREKQLEEIKRQREIADRKLKLEREKLAQLKDLQKKPAPETPPVPEAAERRTGAAGQDSDLAAQYAAAIQNAALNNWLRPESIQNVVCDVHIKQIPGGELLDAHVVNPCNADPQVRDTIEQAIRRAAPLPYKGYETVFRREILFTFCYPREVCPK